MTHWKSDNRDRITQHIKKLNTITSLYSHNIMPSNYTTDISRR